MSELIEERYGKLALTNILASIWTGDWDRYESIFAEMSEDVKKQFPFQPYYNREQIELWYENHFFIPGDYFVSPYFSSYTQDGKDEESRRQDLLCLIGIYEKVGFYYPLEQDRYPDHLGCLTYFISSTLQEQIKALQNEDESYYNEIVQLENKIRNEYIVPILDELIEQSNKKIRHQFFKEFLNFYKEVMQTEWSEVI